MTTSLYCTLLFALLLPGGLQGSRVPLPAPADVKVDSPNHRFFLVSKVKEQQTLVFAKAAPTHCLWQFSGYVALPYLTDDGRQVAAAYPGGNILPEEVKASDALITFFNASGSKHAMSVGEVLGEPDHLRKTSDGRAWGRVLGYNERGQLLVEVETSFAHRKTLTLTPPPA